MKPNLLLLLVILLAGLSGRVWAQAPELMQVTLADGSLLTGKPVGWRGEGESTRLLLETAEGVQRALPLAELMALHGPGPRVPVLPEVHLVGGDVLRGEVAGGDRAGESLELLCPVLGRMAIPVDRVFGILWQVDRARLVDLELPEGTDEALFLPASIGLDKASGSLHRFTDSGVMFAVDGEESPRLFRYGTLVGLAIRDGFDRPRQAGAELITRTGDRVLVDVIGLEEGRARIRMEDGRELEIPVTDVAAITFLTEERVFLSDLEPARVDEVGYAGEVLHPYRRDLSVTGGFLVSGGRTHGRGLGVHSRSELVYRVPDGVGLFHAQVGLDDEVKSLRPRPHVRIRVEHDGEELVSFELQGGDPPRNLGLLRVAPGALLTLEVDFGRGHDLADRVDWLSAAFLPDPRK